MFILTQLHLCHPIQLCCCKYSVAHQMCINMELKIVPKYLFWCNIYSSVGISGLGALRTSTERDSTERDVGRFGPFVEFEKYRIISTISFKSNISGWHIAAHIPSINVRPTLNYSVILLHNDTGPDGDIAKISVAETF